MALLLQRGADPNVRDAMHPLVFAAELVVATFPDYRKPGFLEATQLVRWSRSDGAERFRIRLPTALRLSEPEMVPGYLLAAYSSHGPREHHPDTVCLDLTRPWPEIAGRVEKADLPGS